MSDPSGLNAAETVAVASATTLALPRLGEAEGGFHIRGGGADVQSSGKKEMSREDEEWLENPAHPRNWPSAKKWTNMAIVSRSLPRPLPDPCSSSSS